MKRTDMIPTKAKRFAMRIIKMYTFLRDVKHEYVMSKQLLRCGTSIGANISEALYAQSEADFINKMSIARKEGSESLYWIDLLFEAEYIDSQQFESIKNDCEELMKLLTSSIKTILLTISNKPK